jgi:hypothetical protein
MFGPPLMPCSVFFVLDHCQQIDLALRREAAERLAKEDELRKKILAADVSREAYRESVIKKTEQGVDL